MNLKMSLKQLARRGRLPLYIDNDGRPVGETPRHVENVFYLLEPLEVWFAADPMTFIAGAIILHYEEGRRDRFLSPDVMVVRGVPKKPLRRNYLVWEEGKGPDMVIEITSEWTRDEDQLEKRGIYQDILRVREYFLFDPLHDYLVPPLQGLRLAAGRYRPIRRVKGRLPSKVLGLHLEADGDLLRLYDATKERWLSIPPEDYEMHRRLQAARLEAKQGLKEKSGKAGTMKAERPLTEIQAEIERLRLENEELRRRLPGASGTVGGHR
jgi:Uma2 family endonuclease